MIHQLFCPLRPQCVISSSGFGHRAAAPLSMLILTYVKLQIVPANQPPLQKRGQSRQGGSVPARSRYVEAKAPQQR